MKKTIIILLIYALLTYLIIMGCVNAFLDLPVLIKGTEKAYKMTATTLGFLTLLPPIVMSGFSVACAVTWKKSDSLSRKRFTQGMFDRFRMVFIISIALVFILSLNEEIFVSSFKKKLQRMEKAPAELSETIETTSKLLEQGHPYLALQFAKRAVEIAPTSQDALSMLKIVQDEVDLEHDREIYKKIIDKENRVVKPIHERNAGYTILQLLDMSREAAEKKQWFNSHYWAQLAVDACDGTNTNLSAATEAANYAWRQLQLPVEFDNSEEREYYKTKREGYRAFTSGDTLKAYYIFLGLANSDIENCKDPDVKRFFELAKEDIENKYFFLDETENMKELADSSNIYFSLDYPNGTSNVFYISKAMDIKRDGGLVRYLENLNVIHYDANGDFRYSFNVPYAKVTAQPISEFDSKFHAVLGINKKWKSVPVITLQAVDRITEGIISRPEYTFSRTGLPEEIISELKMRDLSGTHGATDVVYFKSVPRSTTMILPMPYSDFHLINQASSGAENMTLLALNRFLPDAVEYGFSKEVFTENLVQRLTYPFIIFIMLIFCACLGWSYRIDNPKQLFRFRWVLLIPVLGTLTLFIYSAVRYLFVMANYVFVGLFGTTAILVAVISYIVILFGVSLLFLSKKS
ncbi:hypothetical protein [Treponema sp.]|uniref:hypothetical protein n=1 Tax=Treponema sp. TaxID=166 RepID=UPI003890D03D